MPTVALDGLGGPTGGQLSTATAGGLFKRTQWGGMRSVCVNIHTKTQKVKKNVKYFNPLENNGCGGSVGWEKEFQ